MSMMLCYPQELLMSPPPNCVLDTSAVLSFFSVAWPWWGYAIALGIYLVVAHALSFLAVVLLSGREKR